MVFFSFILISHKSMQTSIHYPWSRRRKLQPVIVVITGWFSRRLLPAWFKSQSADRRQQFLSSASKFRSLSCIVFFLAVSIVSFAQPANDFCSNATPVSLNTLVNGSNAGATTTGDPLPYCGVYYGGVFGGGTTYPNNGVWYSIIGDGSVLTASLCTGTNYDSVIGIFQGSCGGLFQIACNNDGCGGSASVTSWQSVSGTVYYIMVSGYRRASGNFGLRVTSACTNPDVPTVSASPNTICTGETITLSIQSANLNSATTWQWYSGSCGGTPVGTGTSIQVSPGTNTTYYVRGEGGCVSSGSCASVGVTVNPKPAVTVTNPAAVCVPATVNLNAAVSSTVSGSTFAFFTDSGATNLVANPDAVSATGTYYVRATRGTSCASDLNSISVTVNPLPTPAITGLGSAYCKDAANVTLTGLPGGGGFTIDDNSASQFSPASLSTGSHTVVYSYTNTAGCSATTSQIVTVDALPNPSITNLNAAYCKDALAVVLTGLPGGGRFTVDGNNSSQIDPANMATGTHAVAYIYTDGKGCAASALQQVIINPLPTPTLTNTGPMSSNQPAVSLTAGGGDFYAFSAGASQINAPGGNTATVTTPGFFSVTATNIQGCTASAKTIVTGAISPAVCRSTSTVLSVVTTGSGLLYQWYKNGQTVPSKMTEIASIQKGTTTASLTVVSPQTTANYFLKATDGGGTVVWYGPFRITVDYGCVGRLAADFSEIEFQVVLAPNPLENGRLQAIISGAGGQALTVHLST